MKSEKEKMLAGELYNAADSELMADRRRARILVHHLNYAMPEDLNAREQILHELLGKSDKVHIEPPFFCDYGYNIFLEDNVYFNFNCTVLDVHRVTIGRNTKIGPGVQIYTAMHPSDFQERANGLEFGQPVTIENDVWVGGGVVICPNITIGFGSVIGAGSVVTRDIPSEVFAAGNPCRVIRSLKLDDRP